MKSMNSIKKEPFPMIYPMIYNDLLKSVAKVMIFKITIAIISVILVQNIEHISLFQNICI